MLDSFGWGETVAKTVSPRFYDVAGRTLSVRVSDERAARAVQTYVRAFRLTPAGQNAAGVIACSLEFAPGPPPPLPAGLRSFEIPVGVCYTDDETYYMDVRSSRVVVEPAKMRRVRVWIGDAPSPRRGEEGKGSPIFYAFQAALRRIALYEMHAGAVVEPDSGDGVLLAGVSNSGKSTLTLRLVQSGWRYLTDDTMLLSESFGTVEAHAFRRYFSFPEPLLDALHVPHAESALKEALPAFPDKLPLDPSVAFPGRLSERCVPRALCFPEVTGESESRLQRLTQAEAMMRLVEQCPWSCYDRQSSQHYLKVLSLLSRQANSYRLFAGRDILDDEGRAAALMLECLGGSGS